MGVFLAEGRHGARGFKHRTARGEPDATVSSAGIAGSFHVSLLCTQKGSCNGFHFTRSTVNTVAGERRGNMTVHIHSECHPPRKTISLADSTMTGLMCVEYYSESSDWTVRPLIASSSTLLQKMSIRSEELKWDLQDQRGISRNKRRSSSAGSQHIIQLNTLTQYRNATYLVPYP